VAKEYDDLARLLSSEHGKTFPDAKGEFSAARGVEFACGIPHLLKGEFTEGAGPASTSSPCGSRSAWWPALRRSIPGDDPALEMRAGHRCGNAFILKPSERDPSVPMRIAELFLAAGLPEGIFMSSMATRAVDTLLTDPRVKAIGFVGSSDIAQYIYSTGTAHGKRVQCSAAPRTI